MKIRIGSTRGRFSRSLSSARWLRNEHEKNHCPAKFKKKEDLSIYPYNIQLVHELKHSDHLRRQQFAITILRMLSTISVNICRPIIRLTVGMPLLLLFLFSFRHVSCRLSNSRPLSHLRECTFADSIHHCCKYGCGPTFAPPALKSGIVRSL